MRYDAGDRNFCDATAPATLNRQPHPAASG
jgi:hypothetical protein